MGRIPLLLALALAALALAAPAASAAFLVNTPADTTDGSCGDGTCSLRDAVNLSNAAANPDVIQLPPGDYLLSQNTQLSLNQPVDIVGVSGATPRNTSVRGTGIQRVFQVFANTTLEGFSIVGGKADGGAGDGRGGGIYQTAGNLTLRTMLVTGNTAIGGNTADGGGIAFASSGTLTVENSAIIGNTVTGGTDRGAGGGLRVAGAGGTANITNTTIDSNTASGGGTQSQGGGIANAAPSTINLQNVTITSNKVTGTGFAGNIAATAGAGPAPTYHAHNTIVAYGTASNANAANCGGNAGAIDSQGNNLDPTPARQCQFTKSSDVTADPGLSALGDNGGPTNTRAFGATSPALNAGSATGCPPVDQRGIPRPQGPACDLGAFELEVSAGGGGGGGAGGGGGGGGDTTKPVLSSLSFSRSTFPAAPSGPSARAVRRTYGAKVSYRLSEKAKTKFTVERAAKGRRVSGKCKAQTRANRTRPRCTRWKSVRGSFTRTGAAGRNSFRFTGRIGGARLKPGRYRLVAAARDDAGNQARVVGRAFRIVP